MVPDCCLSSALAFPSDLGARRPCRGLGGGDWGGSPWGRGGAGAAVSGGLLMVWCLVANTHGEGGDLGPWSLSKAVAPSCVQATLGLGYGFPGAGWKQKSRSETSSG